MSSPDLHLLYASARQSYDDPRELSPRTRATIVPLGRFVQICFGHRGKAALALQSTLVRTVVRLQVELQLGLSERCIPTEGCLIAALRREAPDPNRRRIPLLGRTHRGVLQVDIATAPPSTDELTLHEQLRSH